MTRDASLRATEIRVHFAGVHAVDGVDLVVPPRHILGLIGPNGAGKTTLVNALTGFQHATSGSVAYGDKEITRASPESVAALGIARTFQSARVFQRLTVLENVEVAALKVNKRRGGARRRAMEILDQVGLMRRADAAAGALPFGEERMVGVARALALEPSLVLMDEPAAGLDEAETDAISEVIRSMRDQSQCGVMVIEHDMRMIWNVCDRVHVMDQGRSLFAGTPSEVERHPAVIAAYLGTRKDDARVGG